MLKNIPFFLLLLVAFFCLHGSVENYGYLDLGEVQWVGITITAYNITFFFIVVIIVRDKVFAALITFFIALWYLFFVAIHDWIKSMEWLQFMHSYSVLIPLLLLCNIVYIYLLKRHVSFRSKLFLYLNILVVIYCIWDGVLLLNKYSVDKNMITASTVSLDTSKVKTKPNIYLIVLDGYAGYKSLQDSFEFKNDSFYSFLEQRTFQVITSKANYDFTFYSMASTLNMNYINGDFENRTAFQNDIQERLNEARYAVVFKNFSGMGYNIENYSFFDLSIKQGVFDHNNSFFPLHSFLLPNKIFHKRLFNDLGWMLYNGRFKIDWLTKEKIYRNDMNSKKALKMLQSSILTQGTKPKFCYTHLLLPYEPYYKDCTGNYITLTKGAMYNRVLYLCYLKYTNSIIKSTLTGIIDNDPSAIILIMSDHGLNTKKVRHYVASTYNNIYAVRFPDKNFDTSISKLSNVNFPVFI